MFVYRRLGVRYLEIYSAYGQFFYNRHNADCTCKQEPVIYYHYYVNNYLDYINYEVVTCMHKVYTYFEASAVCL